MSAKLSVAAEDDDRPSRAQALLADVRGVFQRIQSDRLMSKELLRELVALEGRPWADYRRGEGLSAHQMAAILRRFSIQTRNIRVGTSVGKGYFVDDFADAFSRYLRPQIRYTATSAGKSPDSRDTEALPEDSVAGAKNAPSQPNSASVADLSSFPGIPAADAGMDREEYDILDAVDEGPPEASAAFASEAADGDPAEAANFGDERLGIKEFGS